MWLGVTEKTIIYRGAEAEIHLGKYMGFNVVQKRRIHKTYRIKNIDDRLISQRTKEEAKLMTEARTHGVSIPIIYDVDTENGIITMEYLKGKRIKDILELLEY